MDRQRPCFHIPEVGQVAHQVAHVVGVFVDDLEELACFPVVHGVGGSQHRRRRPLDGND